MASSKTVVLFGLLFAIVLLIFFEVATRELAQKTQSQDSMEEANYGHGYGLGFGLETGLRKPGKCRHGPGSPRKPGYGSHGPGGPGKPGTTVLSMAVMGSLVTVVTLQKKLKKSRIR